jgi:hypothetical protein
MKSNMRWITYILILLGLFLKMDVWALNGPNQVELDGERLSVHVKGMALSELLSIVSEMAGIQILLEGGAGQEKIHLDLNASPLSEGLRKILSRTNAAIVYDTRGNVSRVYVLADSDGSVKHAHESPDYDLWADPDVSELQGDLAPDTMPPGEGSTAEGTSEEGVSIISRQAFPASPPSTQ